jgi:hypothetical protein
MISLNINQLSGGTRLRPARASVTPRWVDRVGRMISGKRQVFLGSREKLRHYWFACLAFVGKFASLVGSTAPQEHLNGTARTD